MQNSVAKKIFAVGSAVAMTLGLAAPFAAFAAPHADGTNVSDSTGTVYMISSGQRRPYTSAGAFLSYGFNSFASVVSASSDDLALSVGSFIPPQDGSIVCSDRGSDKGTCYEISGGKKFGFTSAAVFTGLGFSFKNSVNGDVSWMTAGSFLINNTTAAHLPGTLVNNNGTVQLVGANGLLGVPDLATFNSWGYSFAKVAPANAADKALSQTGVFAARVAGQLSPNWTTTPGCTSNCGTNPAPVPGSSLSVSLSSGTPAASNVASGAAFIPFTALTFSAGSSPVVVTGVKVTRSGLGSDTNLNNMYLFNGATMLAQSSSIQNGKVNFVNNSGLFTVAANSTMTVWVKGDLASGNAGLTYAFGIASASDITSNASSVNGSFPITGNLVTSATVSSPSLATLAASAVSVGSSVNAGTNGFLAAQYSLTSANSAVWVKGVNLTLVGSVNSATDIANIKLMANGAQVGNAVASLTNGMAFFDLSATPLSVATGQTVQLQVMVDVKGGANRNFLLSIQHNYDIQAYDSTYGVGILTTGTFPIQQGSNVTVNAGTLTVNRSSTSRTNQVASSQTNVQLATFDFSANGEDVKVFSLPISITSTGGTVTLTNIKLSDDTGFGIGTTVTSSNVIPPTYTNTFGASSNLNYVIPANTVRKVSIIADITTAVGSPVITAALTAGASGNAQGVTSVASITTGAASGNALTVSSTTLSAVTSSGLSSPVKVVPGGVQQKVASFSLKAGGADGVNVSTITLAAAAASVTGNFQNLKLFQGTTQIGYTQNTLTNGASYSFSPASPIVVAAGASVVVDVYVDVLSGISSTLLINQPLVSLSSVTGQLVSSGAASTAVSATGQGVTTSAGGSVTISQDPSTPNARQLAMSQIAQNFGVIKFQENTGNEAVTLTDITITATAVAGTTLNGSASQSLSTLKNFILTDGTTSVTSNSWTTGTDGTGTRTYTITFNNVNFAVAAGPSANLKLTVKADTNDFVNGGASNSQWTFGIAAAGDVTLRGKASNASITPTLTTNGASNTTTVLRTTIGFNAVGSITSPISVTVSPTGSVGTSENMAIFNVTANAAGDAILSSINLSQGGTAPTSAAVTYSVYDASNGLSNPVGTGTLTGSGAGTITLNLNSAAAAGGVTISAGQTKSLVLQANSSNFNTGSSGTNKSYSLTLNSWVWSDKTTGGLGVSGDASTVPSITTGSGRTY